MTGGRAAFAILAAIAFSAPAQADVVISNAATQNMSCSGGVCSPMASDAVLNVSDLESMLASGNVTVKTTGSGGVEATNIVVGAGLSWSAHTVLGLDASESIVVQKKVSVSSGGGLSLVTNDGGTGGELWIVKGGRVVFRDLSSPLSINGKSYKLIKTISSLAKAIAKKPGGAYALSNDYNASVDGVYNVPPISTNFLGAFEGLGNTISNLTVAMDIRREGVAGLFATTGDSRSGGVIENLILTKISVTSLRAQTVTGGLVGGSNQTLLFNDSVSGHVSALAGSAVGGLVGSEYENRIIASYSAAHVTGGKNSYVGGLVGINNNGTISDSYATGTVSGKYVAGGLLGYNLSGAVQGCFATGNVSAASAGGGLVGYNTSTLTNSYATGVVNGTGGDSQIGGLVGLNAGPIASSYSTGLLSEAGGLLGGFVGEDDSIGGISGSYWDLDTSGVADPSKGAGNIPNDPGITGLTTEQFQSGLPTGFDPNIWAENRNINNGFPYLIGNPPPK